MNRPMVSIVLAVMGLTAVRAEEKVAHWTGEYSQEWNDTRNWAEGVVPGQYKALGAEGAVQTVGDFDNVAAFPSVSEGAATAVNLDGLWGVAKITVRNGAPRYVFGESNPQVLSMRPNTPHPQTPTSKTMTLTSSSHTPGLDTRI